MEVNPFNIPEELQDKLEDAFFAEQDKELVARLRERKREASTMEALKRISGIQDEAILQRVLDLGIEPGMLVALSIVPLVEIAWADGKMDPPEREAILKAAAERGVERGSDGYGLLQGWLTRRAGSTRRLEAWLEYTRAMMASFDDDERTRIRDRVLGHAREIAEAAGGFLGVGRISAAEQKMLDRLADAF